MIAYLHNYVLNMSTITRAFEGLLVRNAPVLKFFRQTEKIVMQTYAKKDDDAFFRKHKPCLVVTKQRA